MWLAIVLPRVLWLSADANPDLCFGSGPWTDEGFYSYNARNAIVFGASDLDDFNNRMLSPLLDGLQRFVFHVFGPNLVALRSISVGFGLLACVFFYNALRRVFGRRVAAYGLVFFGLESSFLFYNRLGLMESLAVCLVCASLWALSFPSARGRFVGGFLAALLVAVKSNFLLLAPLWPIVEIWSSPAKSARRIVPFILGASLAAGLYLWLWFVPNAAQIIHMNRHYALNQARPESFEHALWLLFRAGFGYYNGALQRHECRTPVLTTLALCGLFAANSTGSSPKTGARAERRAMFSRFLWLWLAAGLVQLSVMQYAPTRYYLVFFPPLAAVAALTLARAQAVWKSSPTAVAIAVGLLFLHAIQPALFAHKLGRDATFFGLVVGALGFVSVRTCARRCRLPRRFAPIVLGCFLVGSLGQIGAYFVNRTYRTVEIAASLQQICGPRAVILGDWAPNFAIGTDLRAIPIFPRLANDTASLRRFAPDYILTSDDPLHRTQWRVWAKSTFRTENRVAVFPLDRYTLELYRVPKSPRTGNGR